MATFCNFVYFWVMTLSILVFHYILDFHSRSEQIWDKDWGGVDES